MSKKLKTNKSLKQIFEQNTKLILDPHLWTFLRSAKKKNLNWANLFTNLCYILGGFWIWVVKLQALVGILRSAQKMNWIKIIPNFAGHVCGFWFWVIKLQALVVKGWVCIREIWGVPLEINADSVTNDDQSRNLKDFDRTTLLSLSLDDNKAGNRRISMWIIVSEKIFMWTVGGLARFVTLIVKILPQHHQHKLPLNNYTKHSCSSLPNAASDSKFCYFRFSLTIGLINVCSWIWWFISCECIWRFLGLLDKLKYGKNE